MTDTDCRKCGAPMTPLPGRVGSISKDRIIEMTITAYRCQQCDHWNDLKRRKKRKHATP